MMVLFAGERDRAEVAREVARLVSAEGDFVLVFADGGIKPSLCFGYIGGLLKLPETVVDVEKDIAELADNPETRPLKVGPYDLYSCPDAVQGVIAAKHGELALMLNNFLFNNINFFNYVDDIMFAKLKSSGLSDSTDGVPDYDSFVDLIRTHFNVGADIQRLSDPGEGVASMCRLPQLALDGSPEFKSRGLHALNKGQVIEFLSSRTVVYGGDAGLTEAKTYRYLFPLRCKARAVIRTNEFMVVEPEDGTRLSLLVLFCINQWVEEYAYTRTRRGQQRCLYWQTDSITKLIESVDNSRMDLGTMFMTYMGALADLVVASTQGHSFAYLSYDAAEEALIRIFATFKPTVGDGMGELATPPPISLKDFRHYISAFLFCSQADDPPRDSPREIYVRSIGNRNECSDLGLQTIACRRNQLIDESLARGAKTQSEAAFIIHDQGVPVGVICIECPYKDGLRNDLDFLRQVASNASIYRSFLFRIGDQRWLRRNLKLQDVSHELEKLQLVISDGAARERLDQITRELDLDPSEIEGAMSLEERMNCLVLEEAGGSDELAKDVAELVKVFNPPRHRVPITLQMAAVHIVRILLRNRVHARTPQPIAVVTRDSHAGVREALIIKTVLEFDLPQEEIDKAFRQPIRRLDREHVGLYMIGVVVRAWGGRLDFDRRLGIAGRKLEICIPLERGNQWGSHDVRTAGPATAL